MPQPARYGAVHVIFSAARRRADRARRLLPAAARAALDRADPDRAGAAADPARAVQEGGYCQLPCDRAGRSGLCLSERLRRAGPAARRLWVRGADLLRFQRLYRYRDRAGGIARLSLSAEFQPALPRRTVARVLAALAHLAVELAARLSV